MRYLFSLLSFTSASARYPMVHSNTCMSFTLLCICSHHQLFISLQSHSIHFAGSLVSFHCRAIATITRAFLVDANRPPGPTPIRFPTLARHASLQSFMQSLPHLLGEVIASVLRTLPAAPEWWSAAGLNAAGYQTLADPAFWHMPIRQALARSAQLHRLSLNTKENTAHDPKR